MLYELARHPELQCKLRDEIAEYRSRTNEVDFSAQELTDMPLLNAVIKVLFIQFSPSIV